LQGEIDFKIELIPDAPPKSKSSYRIALIEIKKLKIQLDKLLQNEFIRPSVSPWGAIVLFVKKEGWNFEDRELNMITIKNKYLLL